MMVKEPIEKTSTFFQEWRHETFADTKCRNIQLLNTIEKIAYKDCTTFMPCDAFVTAAFLFPECIRKKEQHHATVELHGHHTRGQMVLDHMRKKEHNVTVVQELHEEEFKKILVWTATS